MLIGGDGKGAILSPVSLRITNSLWRLADLRVLLLEWCLARSCGSAVRVIACLFYM